MLTLRPTKMLAKRLRIEIAPEGAPVSDPYADWCVHGFQIGNARYLIFTHTTTLLSAIVPARGVTTGDRLADCFSETIHAQLIRCGFERIWDDRLAQASVTRQFLPIPNRSVLGCMNDHIYLACSWAAERPIDEVNLKLVDVPMLKMKPPRPRHAFAALG